ncbi:ABC transporter ATP-binding protein [Lysinibacillus sp. LZ02]|uniref:ABC transporter ATP-binding protein n=1 Tax=Lysinibacillus sp. LZ02 TaxID=3420668 RepID=UPI003D36B542
MIKVNQLTKDYGGTGIFDLSFDIQEGEVFGFVGTNGAGKTTTIRHLMGFLRPQKGHCEINGLNCWHEAAAVKQIVGYIPGEIAFPDAKTGWAFLQQQAELVGLTNLDYAKQLIEKLQLDPSANLKRMSKGMKQKTAIVASLMHNPAVLLLDEPTTGLDPLMRAAFLDIIKMEKAKGKTIFMSTHLFNEVEEVCDRVAMIKQGRITEIVNTAQILHQQKQQFTIQFANVTDAQKFQTEQFTVIASETSSVTVEVAAQELNPFLQCLGNYEVADVTEQRPTLEAYFDQHYREVAK